MEEFINALRKIIVKTVADKNIGSSVYPSPVGQQKSKKVIRIPKGVQKQKALAMAKIKDIAKIKIEHRNEKKLREILEERGLNKKKPSDPLNPKKGPVIQTNYKIPKKKEDNREKNESK